MRKSVKIALAAALAITAGAAGTAAWAHRDGHGGGHHGGGGYGTAVVTMAAVTMAAASMAAGAVITASTTAACAATR
jgi:hypothetical protein